MATLQKRGNSWRAIIRRQGQKAESKTFPTKRQAQAWAREIEGAMDKGEHFDLSKRTMADLIDRYNDENPDLPAYEKNTLKRWRELVGPVRLSKVRPAHIIEARKQIASEVVKRGNRAGQTLAPATINRRVALLSRVCRVAREEWDWLRDNPCHIRAIKEDNARDRMLSEEERKALAKALADHDEKALLGFVLVAEATGMRAGELVALRWENVDTDTGLIQITRSKNNDKRAVAALGDALDWLKAWRKENALRFGGYVFGNTTGFAPFYYNKAWSEVKQTAGLDDFRFHDLRHGFVTAALQAGMNPVMVQLVSGHRSSHMLKRYAHLVSDVAVDVAQAVNTSKAQRGGKGNGSEDK